MQEVKVAFVGAGYMASEHAKAFSGLPGVVLVGVYNRTRARAEQLAAEHPGMLVCDTIPDLYARTEADLVIVTVKELAMRLVATQCFEFPWVVLLEKPAGYNLADAETLCDAAVRTQRRVYVALNRRAYSSTRQTLELLSCYPEDQRFITVLDQQDQAAARDIYHEPPEVVQNYMYANSIHLIDYFNTICRGEVVNVMPIVEWNSEQPGMVVAKVTYSSGDMGLYEGNWRGPGPWAVTIATSSQRIEMRPLEQVTVQLRGERKVSLLPGDSIDSEFKPGLRYQAQQAVSAVRGESNMLPDLEASRRSMQLVAKIFGLNA